MSDDNLESFSPRASGAFARLRPALLCQHPSLGRQWHRVHERNDAALSPEPPPGQVWLEVGERMRLLPAAILEFSEEPVPQSS
jgi:hypothetical protein